MPQRPRSRQEPDASRLLLERLGNLSVSFGELARKLCTLRSLLGERPP
jgi:hypothetical protein